jgi:hypothetical protein
MSLRLHGQADRPLSIRQPGRSPPGRRGGRARPVDRARAIPDALLRLRWQIPAHALPVMLAVAASSLLALGVIRMPTFVDEADNVLGGCLIARGAVIYSDFFSHHFPLPYYLTSLFSHLSSCSVLSSRIVVIALLAVASVTFYAISRAPSMLLAPVLVGMAAPAYYGHLYLAEGFISLGLLIILPLSLDRAADLHPQPYLLLLYIGFFVLLSSSPVGLMLALICIGVLLVRPPHPRGRLFATFALAGLTWLFILLLDGNLRAFVDQAIMFNLNIYSKFLSVNIINPIAIAWETLSFFRHRFSFMMDLFVSREVETNAATFTAMFEFSLMAMLLFTMLRSTGETTFKILSCLLMPITIIRGDGFHLSPFIVLATYVVSHLTTVSTHRRLARASMILLAALALRIYFLFLPVQLDADAGLAKSLAPDPAILAAAAEDDAVLFFPASIDGYLAHGRMPAGFFYFFLPWQAEIPGAQETIIDDIEANRVAVVFIDQEAAVWGRYRFRDYAPRVYAHVTANFRPVDSSDRRRAKIFVRDPPWPRASAVSGERGAPGEPLTGIR